MTKQEFIELFVEELEIEETELTLDTQLSDIEEWDSMGIMLTIGLVSQKFNVKLVNNDMKELTTLGSLVERIGSEKFE